MSTIETYHLLLAAADACDEKKAEDIRILALDPNESGLTDYFLICNGTNDRQNVAITDEVEIRLKREFGVYPNSVEGRRQGEWILMDYVDFIVHVFSPEKRAFYGLERLRKSAVTVDVAQLGEELKAALQARMPDRPKRTTVKEAAPGKKTVMAAKKAAPAKGSGGTKKASKSAERGVAKKRPTKASVRKSVPKSATKAGTKVRKPGR